MPTLARPPTRRSWKGAWARWPLAHGLQELPASIFWNLLLAAKAIPSLAPWRHCKGEGLQAQQRSAWRMPRATRESRPPQAAPGLQGIFTEAPKRTFLTLVEAVFGRAQACITELQVDPKHWLTAFWGPVSAPSTSSASAAPGPYCAIPDPEQKTSDTLRSWKQSAMIFEIPSSFSKPHPPSLPSLRGQETTICIPPPPPQESAPAQLQALPTNPCPRTAQISRPFPSLCSQCSPALPSLGLTSQEPTTPCCPASLPSPLTALCSPSPAR